MTLAELEQAYSQACADQAAAVAESHRTFAVHQAAREATRVADQAVNLACTALLEAARGARTS